MTDSPASSAGGVTRPRDDDEAGSDFGGGDGKTKPPRKRKRASDGDQKHLCSWEGCNKCTSPTPRRVAAPRWLGLLRRPSHGVPFLSRAHAYVASCSIQPDRPPHPPCTQPRSYDDLQVPAVSRNFL